MLNSKICKKGEEKKTKKAWRIQNLKQDGE